MMWMRGKFRGISNRKIVVAYGRQFLATVENVCRRLVVAFHLSNGNEKGAFFVANFNRNFTQNTMTFVCGNAGELTIFTLPVRKKRCQGTEATK